MKDLSTREILSKAKERSNIVVRGVKMSLWLERLAQVHDIGIDTWSEREVYTNQSRCRIGS